MSSFERLKQLNDIHRILGVIIVEGYDERFGFREATIDKIAQLGNELEAIALFLYKEKEEAYLKAKTNSGSMYGITLEDKEL